MVLLIAICTVLLNSKSVHNRIVREATSLLSKKLGTRVDIDSASVDIVSHDINLYGLVIDDQQQRKMLQMERLSTNVELWQLLKKRVVVNDLEVKGLDVKIIKPSKDSLANFQFIVDSLRANGSSTSKTKKEKVGVDISSVKLHDIHGSYNTSEFSLHQALFEIDGSKGKLDVKGLNMKTDNGLPRKNTGRPKRGFFDVGHLDITADLNVVIDSLAADTLIANLKHCVLKDKVTGFDVPKLNAVIHANRDSMHLTDVLVQQINTTVKVPHAHFCLPSKKRNRHLWYHADEIVCRVFLKDISRPFAPALKNFSLPLNVHTSMTGSDSTIAFRNIRVDTDDKKLTIKATGDLSRLNKKRKFLIRFDVNSMQAKGDIKTRIINQFVVKKLMMKQFHNLGDLYYNGSIFVKWKQENFQGVLRNAGGTLNFSFGIDEINKYLMGNASANGYRLGQVLGLPDIGNVTFSGNYKIDISKVRTAKMRREKGGKLPIGTVGCHVDECSYKRMKFKNLNVDINSDGAQANGTVVNIGRIADLYCSFVATDTDDLKKMKVKPGLKFHKKERKSDQTEKQDKKQKNKKKEKDSQQKNKK